MPSDPHVRVIMASAKTPFFALSIFPWVQEPAAIRPCGLRVFQTHYQDDLKKYGMPLPTPCFVDWGTVWHLGHPNGGRRWWGGDFHSAERAFGGLLVAFLLKKPAYHAEIPFLHDVKVLFQIEILFPHYLKAKFQIEIPFPDTLKIEFQIEIPFPDTPKVKFQIEIIFPDTPKVQFQNEIQFSDTPKV